MDRLERLTGGLSKRVPSQDAKGESHELMAQDGSVGQRSFLWSNGPRASIIVATDMGRLGQGPWHTRCSEVDCLQEVTRESWPRFRDALTTERLRSDMPPP